MLWDEAQINAVVSAVQKFHSDMTEALARLHAEFAPVFDSDEWQGEASTAAREAKRIWDSDTERLGEKQLHIGATLRRSLDDMIQTDVGAARAFQP